MGLKADIDAISVGSAKLATDTATLQQDQLMVTAQQAVVAGDNTANSAANTTLSADLQVSGPVFVTNADGSVSVYQFSPDAPGFTITTAQPAT